MPATRPRPLLRFLSLAFPFAAAAFSGCATGSYDGPSGLSRVRVSKESGHAPVARSEPIRVRETDIIPAVFSLFEGSASAAPAATVAPSASTSAWVAPPSPEEKEYGRARVEIESGADQLYILTHLTTAFRSAANPGLNWENRLSPSVSGFHGAAYVSPEPDDAVAVMLGIGGGSFKGSSRGPTKYSGNLYSSETIETSGAWGDLRAKFYPENLPVFARVSFGVLVYSVDTKVDTNAAAYEYDGLSGTRALGACVLGAGLTTPWDFPVKASVEAAWWLTTKQDPPIETGVGQLSANLSVRF